ncbi:MAG: methylamine utilization protein [Planctomycetes bacterium]|nr:methylamine utilization protein [Planctomycetota bacterium]
MRSRSIFLALVLFTQVRCAAPVVLSSREKQQLLTLSPLPPPPPDPTNRWSDDPKAAALGHDLFFSANLSRDGTVSCSTCHKPGMNFTDGLDVAVGLGKGTRHTPGLLNVAHQKWLTWDGRADSLWSQALHPFETPSEMGLTRAEVMERIAADPLLHGKYRSVFGPFPASDQPHEIDKAFAQVGKAIAAYERMLRSDPAPFDRWIERVRAGNDGPTQDFGVDAIRGAKLFVGRARCFDCHNGPTFSDGQFHFIGAPLADDALPTDRGRIDGVARLRQDPFNAAGTWSDDPSGARARVTLATEANPEQWGQFRTPSLRQIDRTAPYMHQGQMKSLEEVIRFYSTLEGAALLDHHSESVLRRLDLSPQETADLIAFLHGLTGDYNSNPPITVPTTRSP